MGMPYRDKCVYAHLSFFVLVICNRATTVLPSHKLNVSQAKANEVTAGFAHILIDPSAGSKLPSRKLNDLQTNTNEVTAGFARPPEKRLFTNL